MADRAKVDLAPLRAANLPVFFIVGGPGSGKGTQCDLIVKKYGWTHLSSGDLLRAEVQAKTEIGLKSQAIMDKGGLVPNETILDLIKIAMVKAAQGGSKGFLIDGYPREVKQGDQFEHEIQSATLVLYFEASNATLTARLLERGKSSGRSDDNAATIKNRLDTFLKKTQPVVDYYNKRGKLVKIDAERSIDAIFVDVTAVLDKIVGK
uniref:adenylate kinase n=1 Tax=Panagrellus redivivus TaxID=6233 RepID=A0A7E4VTX9_PANRE